MCYISPILQMWKADIEVSSNLSKISLSLMGEPETHIEESDLILISFTIWLYS